MLAYTLRTPSSSLIVCLGYYGVTVATTNGHDAADINITTGIDIDIDIDAVTTGHYDQKESKEDSPKESPKENTKAARKTTKKQRQNKRKTINPPAAPSKDTGVTTTPCPTSAAADISTVEINTVFSVDATIPEIKRGFTQTTLKVLKLKQDGRILRFADAAVRNQQQQRVLLDIAVAGNVQLITEVTNIGCEQLSKTPVPKNGDHLCYNIEQTFTTINGGNNNVNTTEQLALDTQKAIVDGVYEEELADHETRKIVIFVELSETADELPTLSIHSSIE